MRKLTPFSKFLVVAVAVGAIFFGLNYLKKSGVLSALAPSGKQIENVTPDDFKNGGKPGKLNRPIRVCVNTWGGFAGGEWFNRGFKENEESRFYKEYGIKVEFVLIDDFAVSREAFKAGKVDLMWITADTFPTEVDNLKKFDPRVIFQADWSRGGDAIVVRQGINTVADLKGKKVAFALGSPSHTLLFQILAAGDLNYKDINIVQAPTAIDAAAYFKAGKVDAAICWSPDDEDCVKSVPGSKVLMNTKEATNIIADVFYAKKSFIDKYPNELKALIEGWFKGAAELNSNPALKPQAAKILADGFNQPVDFCLNAINNARLCTYGDNINFFNLNGTYTGVKGEDLYTKMAGIYAKINMCPDSVPAWKMVTDTGILRGISLSEANQSPEGQFQFSKVSDTTGESMTAISTKRLTVTFSSGSYSLDENAKYIIQMGFSDIAKSFGKARIRIEGNTDSVGSKQSNVILSKNRAQAVANYLAATFHFDPDRFVIVGNGPDKPVASNDSEQGRHLNRRTDFELLSE